MTVPANLNRITYNGNGSTTVFAYTFPILAQGDLDVYLVSSAGVATLKTITTHYTVSGEGELTGGNVTMITAPAVGEQLLIIRNVAITQESEYNDNREIPADTIEENLDKLTMITQQLDEVVGRSLTLPVQTSGVSAELPTPEADAIIGWDAAGTALENKIPADLSSAFDITLSVADAGKLVKVNSGGTNYEVAVPNGYTDTVITASDEIIFGDVSDSNKIKKDTVQGILDLATTSFDDGSVGLSNFLRNGSFELWGNGTSVAPEGFTFAGAGGTIARESTTFKHGLYSAKIIRAGANCFLYNATAHLPVGITYYKGRVVTLSAWVYASVASVARLILSDGVGSSYSSYHTGNSTWQLLSVTRTINASATKIQPECTVDTSNATCYFDGMMCVEGSSIFASTPNPNTDYVVAFQSEKAASNQTLTTGVEAKLVFEDDTSNTNFYFDVGGDFDGANSKFTARIAGVYQFFVKVEATSGLVASKTFRCRVFLNGVASIQQNNVINVATPTTQSFLWPFTVKLAVGDYVEFYGYQDTGGNVVTNLSYSNVSGFLVGRV